MKLVTHRLKLVTDKHNGIIDLHMKSDYLKFKCKGDIIEYLYSIKEMFNENIQLVDDRYLCNIFDVIEKVIPKSKYFDVDVRELVEEVGDIIFETYSDYVCKLRPVRGRQYSSVN